VEPLQKEGTYQGEQTTAEEEESVRAEPVSKGPTAQGPVMFQQRATSLPSPVINRSLAFPEFEKRLAEKDINTPCPNPWRTASQPSSQESGNSADPAAVIRSLKSGGSDGAIAGVAISKAGIAGATEAAGLFAQISVFASRLAPETIKRISTARRKFTSLIRR
jgi:hypothetical protein